MTAHADTLLTNGRVITVDTQDRIAEAVGVRDGRISFVGSNAEAAGQAGPATETVDLGGRTLIPGFIDNHIHFTSAYQRRWVDCSYPGCASIGDIVDVLAERAAVTPAGGWVLGREFDPFRLAEGRPPDRHDLDPRIPDHPVGLVNRENGGWTFNSRALELMGVRDDTPDPPGGLLARDENGIPLGPMWDAARTAFINAALPPQTEADLVEDYEWLTGELLRVGVTTVHEAGYREAPHARAWQLIHKAHAPTIRVHLGPYPLGGGAWSEHGAPGSLVRAGIATGFGDDWLKIGSLQMAVDGGVFGETAALTRPYANRPDFSGNFRVEEETLVNAVRRGVDGGWQVGLICHGDAGIERALTAIAASPRLPGIRHRLEHAYAWSERAMDRAAELDVIWNTQPVVLSLCAPQLRGVLGDRIRWAFPFRSLLERGVTISGGSDWVVGPINPMLGIDALVNHRSDISRDAPALVADETIRARDALRIYTMGGAEAALEADRKGSIEPGKLADLVVLDSDPLSTPADRLRDIRVLATYVDGRLQYETKPS